MEERVEQKSIYALWMCWILQILVPDWTAKEITITFWTAHVLQRDLYLTEFYAKPAPNCSIIFYINKQ